MSRVVKSAPDGYMLGMESSHSDLQPIAVQEPALSTEILPRSDIGGPGAGRTDPVLCSPGDELGPCERVEPFGYCFV